MLLLTYMGFVALCVLVMHCHNLYGKRVDVIYQEKSYLTFCTFL